MRRDEYVEYVLNEYGSLLKGVLIRNLYDKADRWEECFDDVLLAVWNNWQRFSSIEEEKRSGKEEFRNFDMAEYSKATFGMYNGVKTRVKIHFANHMCGVFLDRFGKDISFGTSFCQQERGR